MKMFLIVILTMLSVPVCIAKDDLSDCLVDAIRFTRDVADYLKYTSGIAGDSLSTARLSCIEKPGVYYVDNHAYYSSSVKNDLIQYDNLRPWHLPMSVETEYDLEKENVMFTCDSIALLGVRNFMARFENPFYEYGDTVKAVLDTIKSHKIYDTIEVNGFGILKDTLYVFTGISRIDNYARTVVKPLDFTLNYVLTENVWNNRAIAYSNIGSDTAYRSREDFYKKNELDLIIPFAYSRFHELQSSSDAYGSMKNKKKVGVEKDNVWILMDEKCGIQIFLPFWPGFYPESKLKSHGSMDSVMYENTILSAYRHASPILHYHPTTDMAEYKERLSSLTDTVNPECRYVMGSPDLELRGDSITVRLDYYEVTAVFNCKYKNESGEEKISLPYLRMLMIPKLTYQCIMAYDKNDGDWHFVKDWIDESKNPATYIERSPKELIEDWLLPKLLWNDEVPNIFWCKLDECG